MRVADSRGQEIDLDRPPQRVVSLVPSITETLFAIGAGLRVVGVTEFCVHPENAVVHLPKVGGTKNPRIGVILDLAPDLVIANREENRRRDVDRLEAAGIPVLVTYARGIDDAVREIALLGRVLALAEPAAAIVEDVERARAEVRDRTGAERPRVVALVWKSPYMTLNGDTFAHDLLRESGGDNPFASHERRYPRIEVGEIEAARPDVLFLPTEPYAFEEKDRLELLRLDCPASESARVHIVEGELLSWYGPRMARALRTFSALLRGAPPGTG